MSELQLKLQVNLNVMLEVHKQHINVTSEC